VQYEDGFMQAIMMILQNSAFEINESHKTIVSFDALKGT